MSDSLAEKFKHNGYTVEIHYDLYGDTESPRSYDSNMGLFLGFPHRQYNIGDQTFNPNEIEEECDACGGESRFYIPIMGEERAVRCHVCDGAGYTSPRNQEELYAWMRKEFDCEIILPVGMIDHSGVAYYIGGGPHWSDSAGWDSGTCGFIVDQPKKIREMWANNPYPSEEEIKKALASEIEVYSDWANGNCYGIVVKDNNGDTVESCWGFIGHDHVMQSWEEMVPDEPLPPKLFDVPRMTADQIKTVQTALMWCRQSDEWAKQVDDLRSVEAALDSIDLDDDDDD